MSDSLSDWYYKQRIYNINKERKTQRFWQES
jgi:hypothetical protein